MKQLFLLLIILQIKTIFAQTNTNHTPNELIIKINSKAYNADKINLAKNKLGIVVLDNLNENLNLIKIHEIGDHEFTHTFLLRFKGVADLQNSIVQYKATNVLEFVEPNYTANGAGIKGSQELIVTTNPNDALFSRQYGLFNNGTFAVNGMPYTSVNDADVDMELAWDIETGDPNLIIAVIDSGLRMSHVDIASRLWNKSSSEPIDGIDNDNNGLIDDYRGWDWVNNDNNQTDDHGHGTNCTGIIGTIANNGIGYAGVNWNSKIMPLKVLDNTNSGNYANMASAIYYAVNNGAKIISMSIGGSGNSTTISNAIDYAATNGVLLVACTMNFNNDVTYYPAGYAATKDNVIAVGSTNSNDNRTNPFFWSATSGSNYGNHLTLVAPGNYIWGLGNSSDTDYNSYWGGTSQATPLVAGIASLLKSKNSALTCLQMKNILKNTAQDQVGLPSEDTAGFDQYMGWGRVNAFMALQQAAALSTIDFAVNGNPLLIKNPIENNELKFYVNAANQGEYEFGVYSLDGKLVIYKKILITAAENKFDFNFPSGGYMILLKNENYTKVFKIIKN